MRDCGRGCHTAHGFPRGSRREGWPGRFGGRHFLSKAEQLERLEEYKDALEKELAGVQEAIEELKK